MSWFLKKRTYPIGADMGTDRLKLVQLSAGSGALSSLRKLENGKGISLVASGSEDRPADVKADSGNWQRWGIEAIKRLTANGKFQGRDVIAAMPTSDVFIDHIKMPKIKKDDKLQEVLLSKAKQKLRIDAAGAMIKYVPTEQDNVLVIATQREKVDRYLAIYEKANLQIKSIGVWPVALTNTYTRFFGRRKADIEAIVMLLETEANYTNVVICRHRNLLFARSIPIGLKQLGATAKCEDFNSANMRELGGDEKHSGTQADEMVTRLVLELTACRQQLGSMYRNAQIERLIFFSAQVIDRNIYTTIAKQLEMPAQIGDCLAAVEIAKPCDMGIDRRVPASEAVTSLQRQEQVNWATAFGLSLS